LKIVVGLGNHGKKYQHNRHNAGFMVLDRIAEKENIRFKKSFRLRSMITRKYYSCEVVFLKPLTFMNNSGEVLKKAQEVYKVPLENILVVFDDMDLDLGRIKFSRKGSSGGHKGMASIVDAAGSQEINRLRIGISRSSDRDSVEYVLDDFSNDEMPTVSGVIDKAAEACGEWIERGIDCVMQEYNVRKERINGTSV
jgi:PTH1 family peptidyl-tRNA hydrolase